MTLNEMPPDIKPPKTICPTDSRLRPDVRKLESGELDGAAAEKTRLEEKQRDARKAMKSRKEDWKPKYSTAKFSISYQIIIYSSILFSTKNVDGLHWE